MVVPYRLRPRSPRKKIITATLLLGLRRRGAYLSLAKLERFQLMQGIKVNFFPSLVSSPWVKRLRVEPEVGVKSWEP